MASLAGDQRSVRQIPPPQSRAGGNESMPLLYLIITYVLFMQAAAVRQRRGRVLAGWCGRAFGRNLTLPFSYLRKQ
jgi:hypothetical protein